MSRSNDARIYVGNLPNDVRSKDLDDIFYKYGKIKYIDLKNRKGPPFAFVEFEDWRDADDAIHGRDGYNFNGHRLRVELQKGNRDKNGRGGGGGSDRYGSSRGGGGRGGAGGGGPPTRRSDYRCIVSGLPASGSWQDLKDHMREAGNVCYADVYKDGTGVVEFVRYDDMKYAVKHLDDTKFRSHEGEYGYIRVKSDYKSKSHSRSRTRSRSPRKRIRERESPSYSPARRSRSRTVDKVDDNDDEEATKENDRSRSSPRHKRSRHSRSRSDSRRRSRSRGEDNEDDEEEEDDDNVRPNGGSNGVNDADEKPESAEDQVKLNDGDADENGEENTRDNDEDEVVDEDN